MRLRIFLLLLLISGTAYAQADHDLPKEIELVFDYILKEDYPELFHNQPFQFRPVQWVITDINDDGTTEVFLQTFPHYRQSPTITIYQIDSSASVSRLTEGLAPGRLLALSPEDDYLDPHATATAMDMQLGVSEMEKLRIFARSSIQFGMSPVLYKNFIHTDKREGKPTFLDLTYLDDFSEENSCLNFQFSQPDEIIAGRLGGKISKYFMAAVGEEIFCYEIKGFDENGWLQKTVSVLKKPKGFKAFRLEDEQIKYETSKGKLKQFKT